MHDATRGLLVRGGEVQVAHCAFDHTDVGLHPHGGTLDVVNSIVSHSNRRGVWNTGGPRTLRHNDVWAPPGSGSVNYWVMADLTGQDGHLSVNPLYAAAEHGDFRPGYGSPAIAADGGAAPGADLRGAPRYDDPRTDNAGTPTSGGGYADPGAFEVVEAAPPVSTSLPPR